MSSSAGDIGFLPLGLAPQPLFGVKCSTMTHVNTTPLNLCPTRMLVHSPCLDSFFPEHRFGSQWSKSHMATGTLIVAGPASSSSSLPLSFSASLPLPEPEAADDDSRSSAFFTLFHARRRSPASSPSIATGLLKISSSSGGGPTLNAFCRPEPPPRAVCPPLPLPLPRLGTLTFFSLPGLPISMLESLLIAVDMRTLHLGRSTLWSGPTFT